MNDDDDDGDDDDDDEPGGRMLANCGAPRGAAASGIDRGGLEAARPIDPRERPALKTGPQRAPVGVGGRGKIKAQPRGGPGLEPKATDACWAGPAWPWPCWPWRGHGPEARGQRRGHWLCANGVAIGGGTNPPPHP